MTKGIIHEDRNGAGQASRSTYPTLSGFYFFKNFYRILLWIFKIWHCPKWYQNTYVSWYLGGSCWQQVHFLLCLQNLDYYFCFSFFIYLFIFKLLLLEVVCTWQHIVRIASCKLESVMCTIRKYCLVLHISPGLKPTSAHNRKHIVQGEGLWDQILGKVPVTKTSFV